MKKIFLFLSVLIFASCNNGSKKELRSTVDSFSVAYFNWQFQRAVPYTDSQSLHWLSYIASQVNQEDIDSLKVMSEGAHVEIKDLDIDDNNDSAIVEIEVSNFLSFDSIGKAPHIVANATFKIPAVKRNGKWKIKLQELPR